ncbi:MAG: efflux RND transporter periplasmic adaptor subunit [Bacteroidota bacterium]
MNKKHIVYTTMLLAGSLWLISACGNKAQDPKSKTQPPVAVDIIVAKHSSFSQTLDASGTVQAQEFVELKPEVSGRIVKLNINEGETVTEGTLLVKLNDDDLQAQLRKSQSQLDIAQRNLKRLKSLLDANGLNQQEYDVADNQVKNTQADIDYTRAQIRKTEVRAPFTGLIGLRNVSPGAFVSNTTILATLQQVSSLKIDFVMPEDEAGILRKGDKVHIQSDNSEELYDATIAAIEPQVNVGTRNLKFRALLTSRTSKLNPGAFVKVLIDAGKTNSAIMIPSNCIIPESRNKKVALIKNGKVSFTVVEIGYRGNDLVEIIKGLNIGDSIAINGLLFLKPDAPVKVKGVKS